MNATNRLAFWKVAVIALCVCVVVFGTAARLVQSQHLRSTIGFFASASLWDNHQRMEIQALEAATLEELSVLSWLACALSVYSFPLTLLILPSPVLVAFHWHVRRFFRPPPVF